MDGALIAVMMVDRARAHGLAQLLTTRGARAFVASNTDALFEKASEERIGGLVIENRLPSFLTGLEIVERLQANSEPPEVVLLVPEPMQNDPTVQRLQIYAVQSLTTTLETIAELSLAAAKKSMLSRANVCPSARRLVSRLDGIQPLPSLILKVAVSVREGSAASEALLAEIVADAMASAAVLKTAHRGNVGREQESATAEEAIQSLGVKRTLSSVLSAGLMRPQRELLSRVPRELRRWYACRCVTIASVSESLLRNLEDLPSEMGHVHGLLQDAGILVLSQVYGERYLQLHKRIEEIPHLRREAEERNQFGTSHADVTAAFLRRLKLPEPLCVLSAHHHSPIADWKGSRADQALLRVLQIGEAVANIADRPTPQRVITLNSLMEYYRDRTMEVCSATISEAIQRISGLSQALDLPAPTRESLVDLERNVQRRDRYRPEVAFTPYGSSQPQSGEQKADPEAGKDSANAAAPLGQHPRVLLLEDDSSMAKYIGRMLSRMGVDVVHVPHVHEALDLANQLDAVVCDIHLGDEDGISAVLQLRAEGYTGPVIVISGDNCRAIVERACKANISEYLLKPFSTEQLFEKLQRYIRVPSGLAMGTVPNPALPGSGLQSQLA